MKWPRTPTAWERSEKVLALCLAGLVSGGALAPFIGWAALPVAIAVTAALGALWRLWIGAHKATLEETLEEAELDRRLRVPIQKASSVDPRRIGVDPATQDILPGGEIPEYLPRAKDDEAHQALVDAFNSEGRWIVAVCGSSKAGKSRLLFEAVSRYGKRGCDVHLIAPKDGAALKSLLQPEQLPRKLADKDLVVWLDDLETFVAEGVDLDTLREWHERSGVVFVATYGGKGSERIRAAGDTGLRVITETLLQHAKQIGLTRTNAAELEGLPSDFPPTLRQEIERHGLAAVMVSGPALERKLMTGRHAPGEPECPPGVAVVRAAVDWARCGRTDPISAEKLRDLWEKYLPPNEQPSDEAFREGLEWALRPVSGTIALLQAVASLLPYDYIVSFVESQEETGPTDAAWACALEDPDPGQALSVGERAILYGRDQSTETAMRIGSTSSDPRLARIGHHNLGVLFKDRGETLKAEAAFRQADEMGLGEGSSNLGFYLQAKGDLEGAEAAFRRAVERNVDTGAFNLGVLLQEKGDPSGARAAFELADELGDEDALNNLGGLLVEQGDLEGAEVAFRQAAERENPDAAFNLGRLLEKKGDPNGAIAAYKHAEELGDPTAPLNLGLLLERHAKDPAGAEAAFKRSLEGSERQKGAFNLGVLLQEQGDASGAEEAFQKAVELGDGKAAVNLGSLRQERGDLEGAENYFRRAIKLGDAGGAFNLGLLLLSTGDPAGARSSLEQALDGGDDRVTAMAQAALEHLSRQETQT
ncbi:MAG: tetratricopeptide repeat protein [Solirubrobacterales bacterium]